jgi:Xaa-Pro aminopeptidase
VATGKLLFFVRDAQNFTPLEEWRESVEILEEKSFEQFLSNLDPSKIIIEPKSTCLHLVDILSAKHQVIELTGPIELQKACKNAKELEWSKLRHIEDGAALCEAFSELLELFSLGELLREYDVTQLLAKYRKLNKDYVCESFSAICGFGENGAIIHYRPDLKNSKILANGIILIDSGGHYLGGTTDVTRNLVLGGNVTQDQKIKYTQVLKGHIALASACFPKGTTGLYLDVLARQFLRHDGYDYPHGTGHGVGNCLSVHEGPQSISPLGDVILRPGMILSNEPGYYKTGEYGIRIENLCYVKESDVLEGFLCFEQLTLVPYCFALIEFSLLSLQECLFLKNYCDKIKKAVVPLLSNRAKKWCMGEIENLLQSLKS